MTACMKSKIPISKTNANMISPKIGISDNDRPQDTSSRVWRLELRVASLAIMNKMILLIT
jgi:hypothetical protein